MISVIDRITEKSRTLSPELQHEALDFIEFLKTKAEKTRPSGQSQSNRMKIAGLFERIAARGTAFSDIKDPVAWQREIRMDRPLPGREE